MKSIVLTICFVVFDHWDEFDFLVEKETTKVASSV